MKDTIADTRAVLKWLETKPSLEALRDKYPEDWSIVENELAGAIRDKDYDRLNGLLQPLLAAQSQVRHRPELKAKVGQEAATKLIQRRMTMLAIEHFLKAALTEGKEKKLGWRDLFIFRLLFFAKDFRRKPVSNLLYRLLWRFVQQPNLLMPLAESHGIYCFFSKALITELAALMEGAKCIEIAAGDGALSRFLSARGIDVLPTDDFSWSKKIAYSQEIMRQDAQTALKEHQPAVVICSWPPAKNSFEQHVFATGSVRRYIVIGSRHKFAFGNWPAYETQTSFKMRMDVRLSLLLLPLEFGGAVYVFDRI